MAALDLRARLMLPVAAALLPVVLLAFTGLAILERQQHLQARSALLERARAVASAIDRELLGSVSALEVLALSRSLAAGNLAAFHAEARAAADFRDSWDSVLLTDVAGRWLLNTRIAPGERLRGSVVVERESFDAAVATRRPAIGNLARGPGGRYLFPVRVPVLAGGELRYVLNALVDPAAMLGILERLKVPADSLKTVFDARLAIVARSRQHGEFLGTPVSASLRALIGRDAEGWGVTRTHEGGEAHTAFSRAHAGAWGVAVGVERETLDAPLRRSYAYAAAAILVSLALAVLAALWMARRIAGPMARLREAARAAGQGELRGVPASGIPEVDEVARALAEAVRELQQLQATLEARVAERTQALAQANAELTASNEQLESFSYSVSHDLRAPLRAVDGYAAMVQQEAGELSEQARQRLQTVRTSAQRMGRLIDDLLSFSRLSRQVLARSRVDVAALARECAADLGAGEKAQVEIGALPACDADPALLRQVLYNLIGNAIKYSAHAAQPRIELGALEEDGQTVYYVRDNGVGFDMQHASKLFGVFERLHRVEEFEGTGVGLAIVQQIVTRHGGRVWAQAAPGAGATFYFTLGPA